MSNKSRFTAQYVSQDDTAVDPPFLFTLFKQFEQHRYDGVLKKIPTQTKISVLDIGCGSGEFLHHHKDRWQSVSGVDILDEQIKKAQKKQFPSQSIFIALDAGQAPLPFNDSRFDLVTSLATLQYLIDLELVFSEVHRVLQPGGYFIFEVPNLLVFWRRFQLLFGHFPHTSLFQQGWDGGVIHYFTHPKIRAFTENNGFLVESQTSSGIFAPARNLWPSLLGANIITVCRKK